MNAPPRNGIPGTNNYLDKISRLLPGRGRRGLLACRKLRQRQFRDFLVRRIG